MTNDETAVTTSVTTTPQTSAADSSGTSAATPPPFALDADRDAWVRQHIRYRLIAVDGLSWWCEMLLGRPGTRVAFTLNGVGTDYYNVTNALVDAGLAQGRALCELLGLRVRKGEETISRVPWKEKQESKEGLGAKGNDIWPVDLGLTPVPFERAHTTGPGAPEQNCEALTHFLIVANRGVAHITYETSPTEVKKLRLATKGIRELCLTTFRDSGLPLDGLADADHRFWADVEFAKIFTNARKVD